MKKSIQIILIIVGVFVGIILLDTLQARIFKRSPIISWKEELEDNDSWVDKGILLDTYYCTKEKDIITICWKFKGSKFTCPIDNIDVDELNNVNNKIIDYFLSNNVEYDNLSFNYVDKENNVVVVGLIDNSKEQQDKFKNVVVDSELIMFIEGKKLENDDKMNEMEGISMTIKEGTLTRTGATVVITDVSGKNNTYGISYRIDKKENGKWIELESLIEDPTWISIGYKVGEDNKLEFEYNWETLYGQLEDGEYRLVKDTAINQYFSVEFKISN